MFSSRTEWPHQSNPLILLLDELKSQGMPIFDLTASNPTEGGFGYPEQEILTALFEPKNMIYHPKAFGSLEARRAVAQNFSGVSGSLDEGKIILTASSSESYSFLLRLLLNPGDHILLPKPSYPLLELLGQLNDAVMDRYSLCYDSTWHVDIKSIERGLNDRTKAIVLVHPNNPTGSYISRTELDAINSLCQKHNAAIICDEVFWDYSFESDQEPSLAANHQVLTFALGGLSKSFGLPQMKLSWIAVNGPEKHVQQALSRLEMIADTYLSVNTPSQNALDAWFKLKPAIQQSIRARTERNRAKIFDVFKKTSKVFPLNVQGGWYAILRLPNEVCEEDFALRLLKENQVFVHPGYFFDFDQGAHLVISLLTSEPVFDEGLRRIEKSLDF